jgi:hypothetical protein
MPKRDTPRHLEPMPSTKIRRLEGDALFAWATMQSEARQLQQQMQGFVQMQAQELGFDLQEETIDVGGYIRPIQREPAQIQMAQDGPPVPQESTERGG